MAGIEMARRDSNTSFLSRLAEEVTGRGDLNPENLGLTACSLTLTPSQSRSLRWISPAWLRAGLGRGSGLSLPTKSPKKTLCSALGQRQDSRVAGSASVAVK